MMSTRIVTGIAAVDFSSTSTIPSLSPSATGMFAATAANDKQSVDPGELTFNCNEGGA